MKDRDEDKDINNVSLRLGAVEVGVSARDTDIVELADLAFGLLAEMVEVAKAVPREMQIGEGIG